MVAHLLLNFNNPLNDMKQDLFNYYKNALANNLCKEYKGRWQACHNDKAMLFHLGMEQQSLPHLITYCYNGIGVSKEVLKEDFKDFINGKVIAHDADGVEGFTSAMYVDKHGVFSAETDVLAFLWCDKVCCTIPLTKSPVLYVGCGSKVNLSLEGYNGMVRIYLFDDSEVFINDSDDESKVIIYRYSKDAKVEIGKYCFATVNDFDKELRL